MAGLVSVILPTYQRAHLISESIESVCRQTYSNWELIVVDDGSTDNTSEVVNSYSKKDKRIKYLKKQQNRGVASARNIGIGEAAGEYIAFIDSDDLWVESKLEKQAKLMNEISDCMLISGDISYSDGKTFFTKHPLPEEINFKSLFIRNFIATSTVILRREILGKIGLFSENLRNCSDYEMWLRIAFCSRIKVTPEIFACYRSQSDSLTIDRISYLKSLIKIKSEYLRKRKVLLKWGEKYNCYHRYRLALIKWQLLKQQK